MNSDYIEKVCIRVGNKNQEPCAVYVTGINGFDMLVCRKLNTGELLMSFPEGEDSLIDFDFNVLQKMRAEWSLENAKKSVIAFQKRIDDQDF